MMRVWDYMIIGAGLAGASAVEGIREVDSSGSIVMLGAEDYLPYDRPPLSKKLWSGKKQVKQIFLHDQQFYEHNQVTVLTGRRAVQLSANDRTIRDSAGESYQFRKLLLATGGTPRHLPIPGGDLEELFYYRTLDDYQHLRSKAEKGNSALIIGGGFIGSELAAALTIVGVSVTMIYAGGWLCDRVFPEDLGKAMESQYEGRGIRVLKHELPASIERRGSRLLVRTDMGKQVESDLVIVGIGILPSEELAKTAGLATGDGIIVDEWLQTSHPDIYAAGDNARFPFQATGQKVRIEHWDNALNQGKYAGGNMAGARNPYSLMPYFFSDLFEFGYEAVGEVDSRMETKSNWQKPYHTGTVYYLRDGKMRGAMMCNVWDKVEEARRLIAAGTRADQLPIGTP